MDSTQLQIIQDNTAALMSLNGTLWVLMGFTGFLVAGTIMMYYTLRGH